MHPTYCFIDNNENNAHNAQLTDMNDQQIQFLEMANELGNQDEEMATFKMFLQYCPDAITYLFDRCLMTPHCMQVGSMSNI